MVGNWRKGSVDWQLEVLPSFMTKKWERQFKMKWLLSILVYSGPHSQFGFCTKLVSMKMDSYSEVTCHLDILVTHYLMSQHPYAATMAQMWIRLKVVCIQLAPIWAKKENSRNKNIAPNEPETWNPKFNYSSGRNWIRMRWYMIKLNTFGLIIFQWFFSNIGYLKKLILINSGKWIRRFIDNVKLRTWSHDNWPTVVNMVRSSIWSITYDFRGRCNGTVFKKDPQTL